MLLVFDVNETLLDLAAIDPVVAEALGEQSGGSGPRRAWFDRMIRSALTVTAVGQYVPFGTLAGAALRDLAAERGREATDDQVRRLADGISALPPHPDVAPALRRLREAGHRLVALTNSVLEVAEAQVAGSGLRELLDAVYSADEVRRLKPAPEPYRMVLEREGADTAVLVAAHDWDVAGAAAAGLDAAFVAREGRRPFGATAPPAYVVGDLGGLADLL
ncbi:haloacid dehalogenase type II [Nocardioides sp. KR10-350]|uniref:haloacid dehalogenase type II n=1 Tax=Nocardioides cheoyonin TaxID=3156615 RepID=UPI0032B35EAF